MDKKKCQAIMAQKKVCVLIPTYNNAQTLEEVIQSILPYTQDIIVVNDGSTDQTRDILSRYTQQTTIYHVSRNKGKGNALNTGFKVAYEKGFKYAITIDSDGQHLAEDIPNFLKALVQAPNSLIVGARNMGQENVPGTSNFGHKFSNFWYRFITGIKLPDTQSGYRLYPLEWLQDIRLFTPKYEYEVEILVRAGWRGMNVIPVPINVYYPPKEERVTHFRTITDFARISVLNTLFVIIAIFYIKPKQLFSQLKKKDLENYSTNIS